jgi:hypothetical protein
MTPDPTTPVPREPDETLAADPTAPDPGSDEGPFSRLVDEQLELAAARLPTLAPAVVHPSPTDHDERGAAHATIEDVLHGDAPASPEMLDELADLARAPELSDDELVRQALADTGTERTATPPG